MSSLSHILQYKSIAAGSYLKKTDSEQLLKIIVGVLVVLCFFSGGLIFFYKIFSYLAGLKDIGNLLMNKIMSLGFLAIFIMLIISNLVTSISTIYNSRETIFLLSTPAAYISVFIAKFIDNMVYSTWAVLLLGLPLIIAYGLVHDFGIWKYVFELFCVVIPFVIIPGCIGVGLSMMMFLMSKYVRPRTLILFSAAMIVSAIILYFKFGQPSSMALNVISDWRVLNRFLGSMGATSFPFLPSYWISETLRILASGGGRTLFIYMLALVSTTLLAVNILFDLAEKYYYKSWLASFEYHSSRSKKLVRPQKASPFFRLPHWLPSDFSAVLAKDLKLFIREPAQWAQFSILLVLLFIYLINLRFFPTDIKDIFWKTLIGFGNFAFSGFILATLSVRFVFPTISLEGKSFWTIASSPMPLKRLFWEKFWSAFLIFLFISEILALVSSVMLGLRGILMVLTFFSVLLMSASLTCLSVGMGAIFPRFEERNPGKIASSAGGMLTTVISLIYVGLMVIIAALPAHRYSMYKFDSTQPFPKFEIGISLAFMFILNLTTIIMPLKLGLSSMKRRDF